MTEYSIPDKVKYRFITPKNVDRSYNRNAFNQGENHLLNLAMKKAEKESKLQSFMSTKITKKLNKAEENRKQLEAFKINNLLKQK